MAIKTNSFGNDVDFLDVNTNVILDSGDIGAENITAAINSPNIIMAKSRNYGILTTGDVLGLLSFSGCDGVDYIDGAAIKSTTSGTIGVNTMPADLQFFTHGTAAAASPTLRMTIAPTGAVTIAAPDSGTGLTISGGGETITSGDLTLSSGNLLLPSTSSTVGQIKINSLRQFHAYGTYNTFVGEEAGNFTLTSTNCTTLGYRAGYSLTSGSYNNLIGFACGTALTTGGYNNGQGRGCLNRLTAGNYNCAMGFEAGYYLSSTASYNTVIGNSSGPGGNANVNYCTYLGYSTGSSQADTNSSNVYIRNVGANESHKIRIGTTGSSDGQQNDTWIAGTYTPTTAIGGTAKVMLVDSNDHLGGLANTTGAVLHVAAAGTAPIWSTGPTITDLTLTGVLNLPTTTSTVGQIKINSVAWAHAYGTGNTWLGGAGNLTITTANAVGNTGVGSNSLVALTGTGAGKAEGNGGFGYGSGQAITDGSYNSLLGYASGNSITTGNYNTCCGASSGYNSLTTGSYNTFIGAKSGEALTTTDSSNILIGYSTVVAAGSNNTLKIGKATGTGNGEINKAYISGIYGKTPSGTKNIALVDSNDQLGSIAYVTSTAWTPTLAFGGSSTGITYLGGASGQAGTYSRIGNICFLNFAINLSSKGSATGTAEITNLPIAASVNSFASVLLSYVNYSGEAQMGWVVASSTTMQFFYTSNAGTNRVLFDDADFTNDTRIYCQCTYFV